MNSTPDGGATVTVPRNYGPVKEIIDGSYRQPDYVAQALYRSCAGKEANGARHVPGGQS